MSKQNHQCMKSNRGQMIQELRLDTPTLRYNQKRRWRWSSQWDLKNSESDVLRIFQAGRSNNCKKKKKKKFIRSVKIWTKHLGTWTWRKEKLSGCQFLGRWNTHKILCRFYWLWFESFMISYSFLFSWSF